jgi:hypothetical protein
MQERDFSDDTNHSDAPGAAPAPARLANPFTIFRQQNQSGGFFRGDLIKLDHTNGSFTRARGETKTPIDDGERFIVNPLEMVDTWTKFIGGEKIDQKVYRTAKGEFAPKRHELGDTDKDTWPKGKDPWQRQVFLPLKGGDGEVCAFVAGGKSAIAEIAELVGMYGEADRHGKLPVIELDTRSFDNQHGTETFVPVFRLKDWDFWDDGKPAPEVRPVPIPPSASPVLEEPTTPPAKRKTTARGDMDDEIPF